MLVNVDVTREDGTNWQEVIDFVVLPCVGDLICPLAGDHVGVVTLRELKTNGGLPWIKVDI